MIGRTQRRRRAATGALLGLTAVSALAAGLFVTLWSVDAMS
jgi:hypothetical protein